jgi:DNA-binding transcriptional regulator YdaS (Cro superfamily)
MENGFTRLIKHFGSKAKIGRALGVTPQAVTKWENANVPSERAIQIEQITKGEITVKDLRPDLYETTAA